MERRDRVGGHAVRHHGYEHMVRGERGEKPPLQHGVEVVEPIGRGQDLADRIPVQGGGERYCVGTNAGLLEKTETDSGHAGKFIVVAGLDALPTDEFEVREHRGDEVVAVCKPGLGRLDGDAERREVRMIHARPRAQSFRPAARLQCRKQTAAAFVAEEVRDEREGVRPVVRAQRRDRERERDGADLANRFDVEPRGQKPLPVERRGDARWLEVAPRYRSEARPHPVFQHIERLAADDYELHQARRVAALVECDQLVPDIGAGPIRKRLRITDQEPRKGVTRVEGLPPGGKAAKPVAAPPRDVLRVHDLTLALDVFAVEPRGDEELGEAVERAFEVRGVDIEEIGGMGE